jgi:hypothetical protein
VEPDFLCPYLDQDRGFGFVRESIVEFVDMSVEDYAIAAAVAIPPASCIACRCRYFSSSGSSIRGRLCRLFSYTKREVEGANPSS